jgi:putative transposase
MDMHGTPEIINTDQGSQFTTEVFTRCVQSNQVKLSMDGKGRTIDTIFIERLWRTVKYENIYLNTHDSTIAFYKQLKGYFDYYNNQRRCQGIHNQIQTNRYLNHKKQITE